MNNQETESLIQAQPIMTDLLTYFSGGINSITDNSKFIYECDECDQIFGIFVNRNKIKISNSRFHWIFCKLCCDGDVDMVNTLIKYIPDINIKDKAGYTFLHYTVDFHYDHIESTIEIIKLLLDNGININEKDPMGYTPLFIAMMASNIQLIYKKELLHLFMKYGADKTIKNKNNETVLDYLYGRKQYKDLYEILNIGEERFYIGESAKKRIKYMLLENDKLCAICREDIYDDIYLTKCIHTFHKACIINEEKCPICRELL